MNDPRWTTVDGLFEAALARNPEERAAFLREASAGNETLRQEVESLLAHERADDFLGRPAHELIGGAPERAHQSFIGRSLGSYRVLGLLGTGGMGEVYRAHDTTLGRDVALKVLPPAFTTDPDRRARLVREAQVLAALNHPHLGAIYGIEETDGIQALVLELVEGDTLADRIAGGPLPLQEALPIARQIAEALEAAHEKGIVHRDLKPANIKITLDGSVKVLDFGLAKATAEVTADSTRDGVILGTPAYMSPEQARGRPVDKRTDIWAFGCVVYEMLTGRAAFGGETTSDTLAAIIDREPDWLQLPSQTPARLRELLQRCLQKDPQRRIRDIADARLDMDAIGVTPIATRRLAGFARRPPIWTWAVAAGVGALAALLLLWRTQPEIPAADLALTIAPPASTGIVPVTSGLSTPRISPNGAFVTYFDRSRELQLRRLNAIAPEPLRALRGTFGGFWSADSKYLVFADRTQVKRILVPDGAPEVIGSMGNPAGIAASLSTNGALLYLCCATRDDIGLFLIPEPGAEAREIHVRGLERGAYTSASFLSGSEDFLASFIPQGSQENEIYLVALRNGEPADPVLLLKNGAGPAYTPAGGGRLLFVRNDNLYAQTLNRRTRQLEGEVQLVQPGVASNGFAARFSVSDSGLLAFRSGRALLAQVTVFDRKGTRVGSAGSPMLTGSLKLSPDEKRVLIAERTGPAWLLELNRPARLSLGQGNLSMLWSPDGSRFLLPHQSRIVARPVIGSGDDAELARVPDVARLEDVSSDGQLVLFRKAAQLGVFSVRLDGRLEDRVPQNVQIGKAISNVHLSPDQGWIAYQVDAPEQDIGLYVQRFPGPALPTQIASSGESPVWNRNGREIVYLDRDRVWSVAVTTAAGQFRAATPEPLFSVRSMEGGRRTGGITQLAMSRDGSRIYYQEPVEQPDSDVIHIRTGWESAAAKAQ